MSTLPSLPKGIYRDDTVHDKLYYSRTQMLAYGALCRGEDGEDKPSARNYADDEYNGDFGALIRRFAARGQK